MVIAVIPAFNEEKHVGHVVRSTLPYVDSVLVVNDESTDDTADRAREAGAIVVTHPMNRGLGASLGTGIEGALQLGADYIVTLDADGQMDSSEIPLFIEKMKEGYDVVLGSRMIEMKGNMPFTRKIAQRIGNMITYLMFGLMVTDSQGGFRGMTAHSARKIDIRTDRMEVSSEIVSEIQRNKLKWTEVPITAIYTDYSLKKGQSFMVGIKTAYKLLLYRLKS